MAIASITAWLLGVEKNYEYGKALYLQYGDDPLVIAIISTGSSSYHRSKLAEALQLINDQPVAEPKRLVPITNKPIKSIQKKGKIDLINAPEQIQNIRNEKNHIYAEARQLFEKIRFMDSSEHRCESALKLLSLMDNVAKSWRKLDYWKETGKLLEYEENASKAEVAGMVLQELIKEQSNLPTYISKARAKHSNTDDPVKKNNCLIRIHSLTTRLDEVKRRIADLVSE